MKLKYQNPKETICLLLYNKKLNVGEISKELYHYRNPKVSTWIGELEVKGWIEQVSNPLFKKGKKKDRREKYYQTIPKYFIDNIFDTLKYAAKKYNDISLVLMEEEKKKIEVFIESASFKNYIKSFIESPLFLKRKNTFYDIKERIALHSMFLGVISMYMNNKKGVILFDSGTIKYLLRQLKKQSFMKDEIEKLDFLELGGPLIRKMCYLIERPEPNILFEYLWSVVKYIESQNIK